MYDATKEQIIKDSFQLVFFTIAILANICLISVLWKNPLNRFRNSPSYTIGNLAVANLIAACGGMGVTLSIFTGVVDDIFFNSWLCVGLIGQQSSFLSIAALAIDRYFAISHPYKYNFLFRQKKLGIILNMTSWLISITVVPIIIFGHFPNTQLLLYELYVGQLCLLTLLTITLYPLNYLNFMVTRKKLQRQLSPNSQQRNDEDLQLSQRLSQTCLIVSIFSIVFTTPYIYFLVIIAGECYTCILHADFVIFYSYYRMLFPITFMINPFIYAWRLPLYRKSLTTLLSQLLTRSSCVKHGEIKTYKSIVKYTSAEKQNTLSETTSPV